MPQPHLPPHITHIIFDVDGTLYEKRREYRRGKGTIMASHEFLRYTVYRLLKEGMAPEQAATATVKQYRAHVKAGTLKKAIAAIPKKLKAEYDTLVKKYKSTGVMVAAEFGVEKRYFARLVSNIDFKTMLAQDQRLQQTIKRLLARGYTLGIITNEVSSTVERVLNALGLDKKDFALKTGTSLPYFCRESGASKPELDAFNALLSLNSVDAKHVAYVGDSMRTDVEPSSKAGMHPILVDWSAARIVKRKKYLTITSIYDLNGITVQKK